MYTLLYYFTDRLHMEWEVRLGQDFYCDVYFGGGF